MRMRERVYRGIYNAQKIGVYNGQKLDILHIVYIAQYQGVLFMHFFNVYRTGVCYSTEYIEHLFVYTFVGLLIL